MDDLKSRNKCFRGSVSAFSSRQQNSKAHCHLSESAVNKLSSYVTPFSQFWVQYVISYYNILLSVQTAEMSMLSIFCIYFECNHIFYATGRYSGVFSFPVRHIETLSFI